MQMMPLGTKQKLESLGFKVFQKTDLKTRRLFTYIHHPENPNDPLAGLDVKYFNTLGDISKDLVENGEYIDINYYCWPVNDCPPYPHDVGYGYDAQIEYWEEQGLDVNGLPAWWVFWLICAAISLTAFVVVSMAVWFIQTVNAPCNYEIYPINECWKLIRAPDCSHAEFNTCGGPDANNDGIPDGQWGGAMPGESGTPNWQKDIWDPTTLIIAIIVGAIAIGAVVIITKLIPAKQPQPQQYYYPPPPSSNEKNYG